jgi:hypothetical protein
VTAEGKPEPIKAKVHTIRKKQMVPAFFDSSGFLYTNYVPRERTVNA